MQDRRKTYFCIITKEREVIMQEKADSRKGRLKSYDERRKKVSQFNLTSDIFSVKQ